MKKVFITNFVKHDEFCDKDSNVFFVEHNDEKRWFDNLSFEVNSM